jgi:GNAT superfamily N-acetyltransferase
MSSIELITFRQQHLGKVQMFCGHSPKYRPGYDAKMAWLRERLKEGMQYTILNVNGRKAGMIETIPGEHAWRGVTAPGYLFIHCFWVIGQNRGHGYGKMLLDDCLLKAIGTNGVAVLASKTHWLPTRKIFLNNGFEVADERTPYELLVKRFDPQAPLPQIKPGEMKKMSGLVLYHSDQCPYMQNQAAIVMQVGKQLGIPVQLIHLENASQAQNSPCPYGVQGIFFNGELLDYRPTGSKNLLALLESKATETSLEVT